MAGIKVSISYGQAHLNAGPSRGLLAPLVPMASQDLTTPGVQSSISASSAGDIWLVVATEDCYVNASNGGGARHPMLAGQAMMFFADAKDQKIAYATS